MILTLNTKFQGYTPIELLDDSTPYREVYQAKDENDKDVALIVYDMNELPAIFVDKKIPELQIIPKLSNDVFPTYIERGDYNDNNTSLCWIATEYVGNISLTNLIFMKKTVDQRELLHQFYRLLIGIKELSWHIGDGCHNNISIDNIIVSFDENDKPRLYLVGLDCVSQMCKGTASFNTNRLPLKFRAPETRIGAYNIKTDIYSLGIVLSYILQSKHPWERFIDTIYEESYIKYIMKIRINSPELEMPEALQEIIRKAIAPLPSTRYKNLEDFATDLAKYLGYEKLGSFKFSTTSNSELEKQKNEEYMKEDDTDDKMQQQTPAQPKANVRIERVKGNGFKDVAGMNQLKGKLTRNFVDIMRNRELAEMFHISPPNGILLWGPPGTGKTFISRKLAEESGMLFSHIKPSDLGNIYIHGSQSMIADLFTRSERLAEKNNCGVLLVFEEFDSLVPKRGASDDSNQANEVAEFLTQLNDCAEKNVFVVATTNRINAIDPAITRKGRMDEIIYVGLPDEEVRRELFEIELLKRPHEDIDMKHIVELTKGFSSSDISFIVKECARCSFDESVKANKVVKINQMMLERIIAETIPSVTTDELRTYEKTRDSISRKKQTERNRIGFVR